MTLPEILNLDLKEPIAVKGEKVSSLRLEAPRVKDRLSAEQFLANGAHPAAMTRYAARLIARCARLPDAAVEELTHADFNRAWSFVDSHVSAGIEASDKEPAP